MLKNYRLLLFVSIILLASCNQKDNAVDENDGLSFFSTDSIKKNVAMLSSDSFMGRKPFTEGETRTIDYLQQQFKAIGVEPGNGTSFLQEVPMVNISATAAPSMNVKSPKKSFTLKGR